MHSELKTIEMFVKFMSHILFAVKGQVSNEIQFCISLEPVKKTGRMLRLQE